MMNIVNNWQCKSDIGSPSNPKYVSTKSCEYWFENILLQGTWDFLLKEMISIDLFSLWIEGCDAYAYIVDVRHL